MGLFSKQRNEFIARKAYMAHVDANRLSESGKPEEAKEKHEKALALYKQAIEEGGCNRPTYVMAYGVLLLRFHQFEKAKELFIKVEKTSKLSKDERKQLRINFAICQWKLGNLDSAIEQLKIAAQDGANSTIYTSLGYILIAKGDETGDYDEAIQYNQEAYDYDEDDAVTLDNLGQLYLRLNQRDKARGFFERAHEIKPRQVDTLFYLAQMAFENGDLETARAHLDVALGGNFSALSTVTRDQAQALRDRLDAGDKT